MILIFLGIITGTVLSLTGAGGSIIAIPLLIWVLQFDLSQAIPTALVAVTISAGIGAAIGLYKGIVRYKAAIYLSMIGSLCAPIGIYFSAILPPWLLNILLSFILFYISAKSYIDSNSTVLKKELPISQPICVTHTDNPKLVWSAPCFYALGFSGAVTGFLSGLLGIGGGLILVPALKKFTNLLHESIIATSLMIITCTSLSSIFFHAAKGNINVSVMIIFTMGTLIGMWGGKYLTKALSLAYKQKIFALVAAFSAIALLSKNIV